MNRSSLGQTALAAAVAGTFTVTTIAPVEATVIQLSWRGAFTLVDSNGNAVSNSYSDYGAGYYANGDLSITSFGAPYFPGNPGPGAIPSPYVNGAYWTAYGWYGARTPINGTLSFDTSTGAGVGTVSPFFFFGDTPGSGYSTHVAQFLSATFQAVDTVGTIIGSMLFSWHGDTQSVSIVLDAGGLLASLPAMAGGGPTSTVSGVGALPATDTINFGTAKTPVFHPLGPTPMATRTLNTGAGCDGLSLATQINAYTINTNFANITTCLAGMTDDGVGGDPMTGIPLSNFNVNLDFTSIHFDTLFMHGDPVPVPPAVWLFGSGLLGLVGFMRQRTRKS